MHAVAGIKNAPRCGVWLLPSGLSAGVNIGAGKRPGEIGVFGATAASV